MDKETSSVNFPSGKIKISLMIAGVIFAVCGLMMKHQAYVSVEGAAFLAHLGNYQAASGFLDSIDVDHEPAYYHEAKYRIAREMYERGDYDQAYKTFTELADYGDSKDRACQCVQQKARKMIMEGDYQAASSLLQDIMYFKGSEELYQECLYRYALQEISDGEWFSGAQILWGIKDYQDAMIKVEEIVSQNAGSNDIEAVLGSGKPIPPEDMSDYLQLMEKRKQIRDGAIAVGYYHTVGLKKDGHVVSCGSNEYGQCDTHEWNNVTQIAAGAYHTAALLKNGKVVACGDNRWGQCDVKKWKNVVQIKATEYNTIGLLADGTVVTCGYNELTQTKGWSGIDRICSGSYAVSGISKSGELMTTHPSCTLKGDLVEADMSISYAIGLTYTGDVIYSSKTPCEWTKAAAVYAGGETVAIIDLSYVPSVYHRRNASYYELPGGKKAVSIALGGTHLAVLYDDGSVYCTGENGDGQCDTSDWNLKDPIG